MNKKDKEIELDMEDSEFLFWAKEAHKRNITFNEMICQVVVEGLKKIDEKLKLKAKAKPSPRKRTINKVASRTRTARKAVKR